MLGDHDLKKQALTTALRGEGIIHDEDVMDVAEDMLVLWSKTDGSMRSFVDCIARAITRYLVRRLLMRWTLKVMLDRRVEQLRRQEQPC